MHLHTTRVDPESEEVKDGIDRTLATIKLLVEQQNVVA